jgi:hypothetical protein
VISALKSAPAVSPTHLVDEKLHNQAVPPDTIESTVAAMDTDLGETEPLEQCPTRSILRENPARQLIQVRCPCGLDQRGKDRTPCTPPAMIP